MEAKKEAAPLEGKHLSPLITYFQNTCRLPSFNFSHSSEFFEDAYGNKMTFDCCVPGCNGPHILDLLEKAESGGCIVPDVDRGNLWYSLYKDEEKKQFVLVEIRVDMSYNGTFFSHLVLDDLQPFKEWLIDLVRGDSGW